MITDVKEMMRMLCDVNLLQYLLLQNPKQLILKTNLIIYRNEKY